MSLLHRGLLAAAFLEIEPILLRTLEAVAVPAAGPLAPLAAVALEAASSLAGEAVAQADAPKGATTSEHVDNAVATISGAAKETPVAETVTAQTAAVAAVPSAAALPTAGQSAAMDAVEALAKQLGVLATQLAALKSNLSAS